jgi:hypothetical protein
MSKAPGAAEDLLQRIVRQTKRSVRSAGPRYTPNVAHGAPNLVIEPVSRALAALSGASEWRTERDELTQNFAKDFRGLGYLSTAPEQNETAESKSSSPSSDAQLKSDPGRLRERLPHCEDVFKQWVAFSSASIRRITDRDQLSLTWAPGTPSMIDSTSSSFVWLPSAPAHAERTSGRPAAPSVAGSSPSRTHGRTRQRSPGASASRVTREGRAPQPPDV